MTTDPVDLVVQKRFERKRPLLPSLKLRYPTDSEMKRLAILAKVVDRSSFDQHVRGIILDAHLFDASLRNISSPTIRKKLESINKYALQLGTMLNAVDVGAKGSAERAGYLLEINLASFTFRQEMVLVPEFRFLLEALAAAASKAAKSLTSKRGPKGGGNNLAFDLFVELLLQAPRQRGGRPWTNYKSADGKWKGSLLEALKILKPYLPENFYPAVANLGRSVDRIKSKFISKYPGVRL